MSRKNFVRALIILLSCLVLISLAVLYFVFNVEVIISGIIAIIFIVALIIVYYSIDSFERDNNKHIETNLDNSTRNALALGNIGIVVYNDAYIINWMSSFFENRGMDFIGDKLLGWIPEAEELVNGKVDKKEITIDDKRYEVNKMNNASVLIFKDISEVSELNKQLNDNACVLGLIAFDNLEEVETDEDDLTFVNINIKTPTIEYFKHYNCIYKTLKNDRILLVLNEAIFKKIYDDRFSILTKIRKVSRDANLDVTLSMAFSRGSSDLNELDDTVENLLELAQTRGGDQVVVRKIGEDASFFSGGSEAREKVNKTKVRVTVTALRDLIGKSDRVIIVGHKDADADCIGSAICMSNIALSMGKDAYIVTKSGGIESMISEVLDKYGEVLSKKHKFIDEERGLELLSENTLVIMVDHHSKVQSNSANLLTSASKIVIVDHHRRKADLDVNPLMLYVEASASSTCEMLCEFLPYMSKKLEVSEEEANIMYIGILIDTDRFRVRTGARTFDVLKLLKQYGADSQECDELSQEPYDNVINRSHIINAGKKYKNNVIISCLNDGIYNRSIASQACDEMVKAKEVEAAFVICATSSDDTIVTARSKGKINVQVIMEKMNGGGHMTAAGLQRKDCPAAKVENELLNVLDECL